MESWVVGGYPLVWEEIQNLFPKSSPVNLGNMGYNGESSEYAPQAVIQQGKQTEGVALQYYAFYNASWYDPAKYFESVASINASKYMMPCGLSIMADAGTAARHVQFTGDVDGVVTENGTHTAMRCFQGYWWFPPSCRSNSSACVPYNTGGIGWGWETVAQRRGYGLGLCSLKRRTSLRNLLRCEFLSFPPYFRVLAGCCLLFVFVIPQGRHSAYADRH